MFTSLSLSQFKVPIRYEEDDRLEILKKFPPPLRKGRDPGRDFNIVSGKFKADDESKQQKIAADIRESCDKKFWKTHSYDYIKIKYHDPKLQEKYIQVIFGFSVLVPKFLSLRY
jgi:hypothetical protein